MFKNLASGPEAATQRCSFLGKDVLKICSKFTGEHPCLRVISIKFQRNFIESNFITFWKSHFGMSVLL